MRSNPLFPIAAGALACVALALLAAQSSGPAMAERLTEETRPLISEAGGRGVTARFASPSGWPSRHPILTAKAKLPDSVRSKVAHAVASYPGVAGVRWADGSNFAQRGDAPLKPLHCQDDVAALLRARTIRFEESSSRIDAASRELVDEVAEALRPCLGSIIAITGHTDSSGPEPGNLALSQERADAVKQALIARDIPDDGLRAIGVGSAQPVEGLAPEDAANRRIEFSVIEKVSVRPTPIDTPAPR